MHIINELLNSFLTLINLLKFDKLGSNIKTKNELQKKKSNGTTNFKLSCFLIMQ